MCVKKANGKTQRIRDTFWPSGRNALALPSKSNKATALPARVDADTCTEGPVDEEQSHDEGFPY